MILMTKNLDQEGLRSIVENYDLYYIDLWGVVHNGIKLHPEAIKVLNELEFKGKEYVLLTNAPRPSSAVKSFLKNFTILVQQEILIYLKNLKKTNHRA